jgi:hypothetical protein
MSIKLPFATVLAELEKLRAAGQQVVDIASLASFLRAVESHAPVDTEIRKLQHDSALAQYKAERDIAIEMLRSIFETSKTALTTSILVNGGASVALLALIGSLAAGKPATAIPLALIYALVAFATGVLFGAIATGTTYVTQYCYEQHFRRSALGFHVFTVVLVLGTYAAFATGVVAAYHGFIKQAV